MRARSREASSAPVAPADVSVAARATTLTLAAISVAPVVLGAGKRLFDGKAKCAGCHMAQTFSEPGWNLHEPSEICTDSFQADRSPTHRYRTTPLKGLYAHSKGGFYHDGRFATLGAVVAHYDSCLKLGLSAGEQRHGDEQGRSKEVATHGSLSDLKRGVGERHFLAAHRSPVRRAEPPRATGTGPESLRATPLPIV